MFQVNLDYNRTLDHDYTQFAGDDPIDLLDEGFYSSEFASVVTGDFIWEIGKWTTTVHGTRYGSTAQLRRADRRGPINGVEPGSVDPYALFNLNVDYQLTDNSSLALTVNNVRTRTRRRTRAIPDRRVTRYYNIFNYNGYGRAYWLEYQIELGAK